MEREKAARIVKRLVDGIEGSQEDIEWAVIGSTNLLFHGMEVYPNDIDIITFPEHARKFETIFSELVSEPFGEFSGSSVKQNDSYRLVLEVEGVEIEIIGEEPGGIYSQFLNSSERMDVNGRTIPCISLESEAEGYRKIGRDEKARKIEDFLDKN